MIHGGKTAGKDEAGVGIPDTPFYNWRRGLLCCASRQTILKGHAMRTALLFCAFALALTISSAQEKAVTPPLPSAILLDDSLVHVLCARLDADYDGNIDGGEVPASWNVYSPSTFALLKSTTFDWKDVKVTRCGATLEKDMLDIVVGEDVMRFQTTTQASLGKLYEGKIYGLDASQDGKTLWMSERPSFTEQGSVIEYNTETKEKLIIPVGVNPQQISYHRTIDGLEQALVICEELFGKGNGTFRIIDLKTTPRTQKIIEVGDTPNYFVVDGDTAYVVVNGSHTIVIVDLVKHEKIATMNVGTTGYDGPREAAVWFDPTTKTKMLLVSTFAEDIRVFNITTRQIYKKIDLSAKPEGMALNGNYLWVTQTFKKDTYEPSQDVAIYDLLSAVSVRNSEEPLRPKALLATSGVVHVAFDAGTSLSITDIAGRTTPYSAVVSGSQTVDCSALPRGTYLLTNGTESVTLMR